MTAEAAPDPDETGPPDDDPEGAGPPDDGDPAEPPSTDDDATGTPPSEGGDPPEVALQDGGSEETVRQNDDPDEAASPSDPTDADDTRAAIMRATYRALCAHGYADLTIQRIGDEFDRSKSLLYHHYDGKDDLLVDFLSFVLDRYEAEAPVDEDADARAHLDAVLDHLLAPELDDERRQFTAAMVELRGQAPHDPAYREQFARTDRFFRDRLAAVVRRGVEQGTFREVDPERVADLLLTTVDGAMARRTTTGNADWVPAVREELDAYLEARLLTDDGEGDAGGTDADGAAVRDAGEADDDVAGTDAVED